MSDPTPRTPNRPLTTAEVEAIATAAAMHHLRAAQAGASASGGMRPDLMGNWAKDALLQSVQRHVPRTMAWGTPGW